MINLGVIDRYSKALFDLTSEQEVQEEALKELSAVAQLLKDNQYFDTAIQSKNFSKKEKEAVLEEICTTLKTSTLVKNFLFVVLDNKRGNYIKEIYASYLWRYQKSIGIKKGVLTTPLAITDEERILLEERFSKELGGKVELTLCVDEALIGGAFLEIEGAVYADDLNGRLKLLTKWMKG